MIPGGVWTGAGDGPNASGGALGSRGSRSHSAPVHPVPEPAEPSPAAATVPTAPPRRRWGGWVGTLAGFAAGVLVGSWPFGASAHTLGLSALGLLDLVLIGGGIAVFATFLRRRSAASAPPMGAARSGPSGWDTPPARATTRAAPSAGSSLERGVRDIRQMDPGFDPAKLAGYTGMVFRDVQSAWTVRDIGCLRDRLTPELYGEVQAHCDRIRNARQANRVDQIEIRAEITEAWQENGRDYVTAYIGGSMLDYTVDELTDRLLNGSRAIPKAVEEFWTFTRPAGLNFWMLSAIQTS